MAAHSPSPRDLQALKSLLLSLFSVDELRRLLLHMPDAGDLSYALPSGPISPMAFADAAVEAMHRHGLLGAALFDGLIAERPRRRAEIERVRALFAPAAAPPQSEVPHPPPSEYGFFLIHASPDKGRAAELYEALRARGCTVFFDARSIEPGARWGAVIPQALDHARVAVVLISRHAHEARYFGDELHRAIERHKDGTMRIVPVFLDGWGEAPYGIAGIQGLDARALGTARVADALVKAAS
ncbi:MAG: toll/interleukin-1 receptor domain-containing protein [Pseudomonadota bacterium]